MLKNLYKVRENRCFPRFLIELVFDMFSIVEYWDPYISGPEKGRLFEELFERYCKFKKVDLSETSGSRTLRGQCSASGFMHENDGVIAAPGLTVHIEMKHLTYEVGKNEILIFNQKGIDFLLSGNKSLYSKPLYRVLLSGNILSNEARRFAMQWGIVCIEPNRLPLPLLYELANYDIKNLRGLNNEIINEVYDVVPKVVTSLQSCINRISGYLSGQKILIDSNEMNRIINHIQRRYGDEFWSALDDMCNGTWLEDHYEKLNGQLGLDEL